MRRSNDEVLIDDAIAMGDVENSNDGNCSTFAARINAHQIRNRYFVYLF